MVSRAGKMEQRVSDLQSGFLPFSTLNKQSTLIKLSNHQPRYLQRLHGFVPQLATYHYEVRNVVRDRKRFQCRHMKHSASCVQTFDLYCSTWTSKTCRENSTHSTCTLQMAGELISIAPFTICTNKQLTAHADPYHRPTVPNESVGLCPAALAGIRHLDT